LTDRPEESLVRELAERYNVRPPDQLLGSLQQFDAVATEEIQRIERENMDLGARLDRIEFLYSIRINAFGSEPSVGGLETILGPGYTGIHGPPEPETETLVRDASFAGEETREQVASPGDVDRAPSVREQIEGGEYAFTEEEMDSLKTLLGTSEDSEEENH